MATHRTGFPTKRRPIAYGPTGFNLVATPDNGATLALLGLGLAVVAFARRSFKA
jgi:VPDSG-CTERM motif